MPLVEFEPMIPAFERVHALDRAATVIGLEGLGHLKNPMNLLGIEPATFRLVVSQPTTLPKYIVPA
jgi:hypothetical protein